MQNKKKILILGSKYGSKLPNTKVDIIYSANGAAERAALYKTYYPDTFHINITGGTNFLADEETRERIIKSKPDKIIVRTGPIEIPEELTKYNCEIVQWDSKKNTDIQAQFFKLGWLDIFFGEIMYYEKDFLTKFRHLYRCIKHKGFLGCSSGLFAIFFAAMENPNSEIISSGIGLVEGRRYYEEENSFGFMSEKLKELVKKRNLKLNKYNNISRFRVERFLAKRVKDLYKNNIFSLDKDFIDNACGELWQGETLNH
jgi:hypothetical protein